MTRPHDKAPGAAGVSLAASVVAHIGALGVVGWIALGLGHRDASASPPPVPPPEEVYAVELPGVGVAQGTLLADRPMSDESAEPAAHGGATFARVDEGKAGRGGDARGPRATNLAAYDDAARLSPDPLSRLDRDQEQRMQTARDRATREDRRATTNPMELTLLASGTGARVERRPLAETDPSRGSLIAPPGALTGGDLATAGDDGPARGALRRGSLVASPGLGVRDGAAGDVHRASSPIARARPDVVEGPPTVTARDRARANDTVDSEQEVTSTVRSLVHASVAGGSGGEGRGGESSSGDPGAGGNAGHGSTARALGAGDGDVFDLDTSDPRLMPYFRRLHARLQPLWARAFPRSAMVELKQGTVIFEFVIAADGAAKVTWPPVRPSGIDEFDRNVADAIRRGSPFEPIPKELLGDGRTSLRIRAPFVANNPIVK